jgi:hypothetical protein
VNIPAPEVCAEVVEHVTMTAVLVHVEGGLDLPAAVTVHERISMHCHGEAPLSVHEPNDPQRIKLHTRLCGFLLIVRTGRIVTFPWLAPYEKGVTVDEYRRILGVSSI